ncbi:MAG: hypothetical protein R3302_04735 [Sulfurimonadaceae bacterium]|nr:hypothetical protein [Sulfurimonadaceae bacterium]
MRTLLGLFLLIGLLWAESPDTELYSDEPDAIQQKVLYLNYVELPERVFKGEIFTLTVKVLSTEEHFEDISYSFKHGNGYKLLTPVPERRTEGRFNFDTFYFLATSSRVTTPQLTASLKFSDFHETSPTTLPGKKIDVVTLNPPKGYANILAESFEITNYKTTRYNRSHNIAVFTAEASRSDIEALKLRGYEKQGIESVVASHHSSLITYYAVIPKKYENLTFSYFNLTTEKFEEVLIPIIVDDDTVSTQSDLKPTEHKHTRIKISIAAAVAGISFLLFIFRRKVIYFVFVIIPAIYIAYAAVPIQYACIKANSPLYLLPMENGTTFEITTERMSLEVQGSIEGFKKVKLKNNKIGWVRNEDLCLR